MTTIQLAAPASTQPLAAAPLGAVEGAAPGVQHPAQLATPQALAHPAPSAGIAGVPEIHPAQSAPNVPCSGSPSMNGDDAAAPDHFDSCDGAHCELNVCDACGLAHANLQPAPFTTDYIDATALLCDRCRRPFSCDNCGESWPYYAIKHGHAAWTGDYSQCPCCTAYDKDSKQRAAVMRAMRG